MPTQQNVSTGIALMHEQSPPEPPVTRLELVLLRRADRHNGGRNDQDDNAGDSGQAPDPRRMRLESLNWVSARRELAFGQRARDGEMGLLHDELLVVEMDLQRAARKPLLYLPLYSPPTLPMTSLRYFGSFISAGP